jgi:uncharacterized membrane protein
MTGHSLLVFVTLFTTSIWVGGFVTIAVVTRAARRQLTAGEQVRLFREIGRSFGIVGGTALVVALACSAALAADHEWGATRLAGALIAAALVVATGAGVAQARGMTRLRERAVRNPDDDSLPERIRKGAARALGLRAAIGALTIALLFVASILASG